MIPMSRQLSKNVNGGNDLPSSSYGPGAYGAGQIVGQGLQQMANGICSMGGYLFLLGPAGAGAYISCQLQD